MAADPPYLKVMWQRDRELTSSVRSVQVEDSDRLVDKATIVLGDPHGSAPDFRAGQVIEVTMGWEDEHAVVFSGLVQDSPGSAPAGGAPSTTIVAYDPSSLMNRQCRDAHHTGLLSAVVRRVVAGYPTIATPPANVVCDPDPEFTGDPQLRQHGLSDLQFLQWLAWRYGHRAFVEYNDDRSQFYFVSNRRLLKGKALGALRYCRGFNELIEFSYQRVASRQARQRIAAAPDPASNEAPLTLGDLPAAIEQPAVSANRSATLGCVDPAERARYEAGVTAATSTPPLPAMTAPVLGLPSDPRLAEAVTALDPTQVLGLRGTGRAVGTIKLRAKGKVAIEGVATWAEGDWYVTKAVHQWRDTSTSAQRGASYETAFTVTR
ncbi:MAG: hypothetical protein ACRD12_02850 [Acidimicrobiales bacterium]